MKISGAINEALPSPIFLASSKIVNAVRTRKILVMI
jgi:hypothetical protein